MKRMWMSVLMVLIGRGLSAQGTDRAIAVKPGVQQSTGQEARVALVIGNGSYKDAPLRNPVKDALAMAAAVKACGFTVTRLENATRSQMREAIRAFGAKIAEGGVGLFYYAGHGMQVKGRNYLIPVGADIAQEDEVEGEAVEVDAVLAKMETARNRLNILILDACRDNPFGRSFRSSQHGLAQMDAPTGTYVAFATSPGRTAADGRGANGLYTDALLRQLKVPGLKLEDVFKRTRAEVLQSSEQKQTPWENSSIVGDFYFLQGSPSASALNTTAESVMPPPPVAIAQVGGLQVSVNAPDSTVRVDEQIRGVASPRQALNIRDLPVGMVGITVEAPGYAAQQKTLEILKGQWVQVDFALLKADRSKGDRNPVRNNQPSVVSDYSVIVKTESPSIENLLKETRPLEALRKAESLLPAELPVFDKSTAGSALKASLSFSGLTRLYLLTAKSAGQAGDWEKALDLCTQAQACAKVNDEATREALTPVLATWSDAIGKARQFVAEHGDRVRAIQAKPDLTSEEQQEIEAFKVAQGNLSQGPKTLRTIQDNLDATRTELDTCAPRIEYLINTIRQEAKENAEGIAATRVNGKLVKENSGPHYDAARARYFEHVLESPVNYTTRPDKVQRMNFLFRLRHNAEGAGFTGLVAKVDRVIDQYR